MVSYLRIFAAEAIAQVPVLGINLPLSPERAYAQLLFSAINIESNYC